VAVMLEKKKKAPEVRVEFPLGAGEGVRSRWWGLGSYLGNKITAPCNVGKEGMGKGTGNDAQEVRYFTKGHRAGKPPQYQRGTCANGEVV